MFQDNPQQPQTPQTPPEQPKEAPKTPQQEQPQQQQQQQQPTSPPPPPQKRIQTTQEDRMWAAIGYIAFLGVVTMAMKPKSEFCRKHAAQGLLLFAVWFIGLILLALPITIISFLGGLILFGATIIAIFGIIRSIQSYELNLPVLSDIAKKIPVDTIIGAVTGKTPEKPAGGEQKPSAEKPSIEQPPGEQPTTEEPKEEKPKQEEPPKSDVGEQ